MSSDDKYGLVATLRECPRCLRILEPTSGDDCPAHTLPCCGGHGIHALGCERAPAYMAGMSRAQRQERDAIDVLLGRDPVTGEYQ